MDPTLEDTTSEDNTVAPSSPSTTTTTTSIRANKGKRNYRTKKRDDDNGNEGDEDMNETDKIESTQGSTQQPQQPQQPAATVASNLPYVQSQNAQNIGEVYPGLARLSFLDQDSGAGEAEEGGIGVKRPRRPLQQKPTQQQSTSGGDGEQAFSQSTDPTSAAPADTALSAPPFTSPSAMSSGLGSDSSLVEIKDTATANRGRGLFSAAKDVLKPGTLVFKELGYCQVVNDASLSSVCSACFKDTREEQGEDEKSASAGGVSTSNQRKLVRCAGCKVVWYCNKTCQIKDWKLHHQLECQGIQQSMKNPVMKDVWTKHSMDTTTVRALCRLVRRRERVRTSTAYKAEHGKMNAAQKQVNEVYYSGLDQKEEEWLDEHGAAWIDQYLRAPSSSLDTSSKGALEESAQLTKLMAVVMSCIVSSKEDRAAFMRGSGESEGEGEATKGFELLRKLSSYGFSVTNLETTMAVGLALYVQSMPFMNHSCLPNCVYTFKGSRVECRVIRDIHPGEELTISYIDQIGTTQERQKQLKEQYHFTCICPLCQYFPANPLVQPNQEAFLAIIPNPTFAPILDPKQGFVCPNTACASRSDIGSVLAMESQLAIYNKVELKCDSCGNVAELTQEIVQENQEEAEQIIARFVREMNSSSDQQPKSGARNFELAKVKLPETTDEKAAEEAAAAMGGMKSVHEPSAAAMQYFDEAYRVLTGTLAPQARTQFRPAGSLKEIDVDAVHRSALHRLVRQLVQTGFDEAVSHKNWVFALQRSLVLEQILNNTYIGHHPLKAIQGYYTCKIVNLLANLLLEESTIEIEESDHEQDSDDDMAGNSDDERDLAALRDAMGGGGSKGSGGGSMQEQLLKRKQAGSTKAENTATKSSKAAATATPIKRIQTESSRQLLMYLKSLIPKIEDPMLLQQFRVCWGKDGKLASRYRYQVDSLKQALYYAELPFQETKP
ncbi:SET and MYND domain-containing protein 3 [Mortierella sp. AD031]|nr:SET and MYND domain-containing protein 3 [Mortierella sp. AD031]KAG0218348.1 SET and MYND domain-containing protein 3 [Mortierella sp. NVP41]